MKPYIPKKDARKPNLKIASSEPLHSRNFRKHLAYQRGWRAFQRGYYWEAHEYWEPVWRATRDPAIRHFLQALIQISAAQLKRKMGHYSAVRALLKSAERHLHASQCKQIFRLRISTLMNRICELRRTCT